MAAQWSYNSQPGHSTGTGYNQYPSQYPQQAPQNYGQQNPQQYGQQHFQQLPQSHQQQPPHHYPQPAPQQQYPQQTIQQQYPPQAPQQQYLPQQRYASPQQQYSQQQYPQQQYPQQQYPHQQPYEPQPQRSAQQQYPPQTQYPLQQGGQYPNQYPSAASTAYASQPQPIPTQQGCYNCGDPGHWAQACSEPIRDNPAGTYNRPPPFKRQKPNPPVVTKYAVPPHIQQQHGPTPQAFGGPYAQQSYPQYQGPHGPPTPQSGHSPHQQWPQQPYQQQYQQAYPQQQQYSQQYHQPGYQYQQQPFVPNAPPTPATPHASHQSNQASPQAAPSNPEETTSVRQSSRNSSVSMHSMSVTPTLQSVEVTVEADDDDLGKLDVPDIPTSTHGSFASLVDRPLPANFIVADALEPFDPPPPENNGHCQSKYTVIDKLSTFTSSIKETKHWEDMKSDPIFRLYSDKSRLVPLERILGMYRTRLVDNEQDPADLEDGEWTRDTTISTRLGEPDLTNRVENPPSTGPPVTQSARAYANGSWGQKPQSEALTTSRTDHPVETVNSMQGAGGHYHWKRKVIRPIPPPPMRDESPVPSPERTPPMRSRTPSMYELNEIFRQEEGVRPDSDNHTSSRPHPSTTNEHSSAKKDAPYDLSDPFEPPPLPAHLRKPASYDGAADGAMPTGSPNGQVNGHGTSGVNGNISNGRSCSNEQSASPRRRRSDAANGRKREAELSDEDNTPKRRQVDDTKCRLKKRQTKVAAAYR
ncbi:MAG: hypothetical protein L6R40_007474 [Gallowayella cf. fulva]|nr:MAG: hypothetical protein L6R40_007474 [Xanthomendoza cf. fulva]